MLSILGFLIILAPLVIVHEFGHYIFARIFGVKAEVFSIGFGPRLWFRQIGETEWRVSAIPLGGYVKLLGEDSGSKLSAAEKKRSLNSADPWKRFFIFFGGPLFNFLFAILVFMAIMAIGEPKLSSVASRVVPGSPAEQAGFQSGDRIVAISGTQVSLFSEVVSEFMKYPGQLVEVGVRRGDQQVSLSVTPSREDGFSRFGEETKVGRVFGLLPYPRDTELGVSNPKSPAALSGLETGWKISHFNGKEIQSWEKLEAVYQRVQEGKEFRLTVIGKSEDPKEVVFEKPSDSKGLGQDFGLHSSELFIDRPVDDSPAKKAGILKGDRIVSVEGQAVQSFYTLKDSIQAAGEDKGTVDVSWERGGEIHSRTIVPMESKDRDPVLRKITNYTIGIVPMLGIGEADTIIERTWNPFVLLYKGTVRMVDFCYRNIVSIGKMFSGDVSVATLGGPILIGKIAGDSLQRGLISFLTTMAILSIGLGILNVLPIPVLDGGHLMLLFLEMIRGKPLTIRQMEILQQVGLTLIVLLMVVVMKNDLSRLAIFD